MVNECSWMSGICFSFYHSTYCCGVFKRSPPLISLFCQSVPKCRLPKNPASPRGKPRGSCGSWFHSTFCTVPSANGRLRRWRVAKLATPTKCGENHWIAAANGVHSLSFAPGTAGDYEPPLPVQRKPRWLGLQETVLFQPVDGIADFNQLQGGGHGGGNAPDNLLHGETAPG